MAGWSLTNDTTHCSWPRSSLHHPAVPRWIWFDSRILEFSNLERACHPSSLKKLPRCRVSLYQLLLRFDLSFHTLLGAPLITVIYPLTMVIFHSYVSLPEGIGCTCRCTQILSQCFIVNYRSGWGSWSCLGAAAMGVPQGFGWYLWKTCLYNVCIYIDICKIFVYV